MAGVTKSKVSKSPAAKLVKGPAVKRPTAVHVLPQVKK